jgi:hypothetical protein
MQILPRVQLGGSEVSTTEVRRAQQPGAESTATVGAWLDGDGSRSFGSGAMTGAWLGKGSRSLTRRPLAWLNSSAAGRARPGSSSTRWPTDMAAAQSEDSERATREKKSRCPCWAWTCFLPLESQPTSKRITVYRRRIPIPNLDTPVGLSANQLQRPLLFPLVTSVPNPGTLAAAAATTTHSSATAAAMVDYGYGGQMRGPSMDSRPKGG